MVTTVVCWNIDKQSEPWRELVAMGADVALLQEAGDMPEDIAERRDVGPGCKFDTGPDGHWDAHTWNSRWHDHRASHRFDLLYDRWAKVVKLSNRVDAQWYRQVSPIGWLLDDEIAVSGIGTIAAARIRPAKSEPFVAISMYARWLSPHPSTDSTWSVGYSDASAHRILSDLSTFIGNTDPATHRILAAGDLNMVYGELDKYAQNHASRTQTVLDRMDALGFEFLGPQAPEGGRRAGTTPRDLPADTDNVPTYHTNRQTPQTAANQLDYVFASRGFHNQITVHAMNSPAEWGPSDHCRIIIEIADD